MYQTGFELFSNVLIKPQDVIVCLCPCSFFFVSKAYIVFGSRISGGSSELITEIVVVVII